MNNNASQLEPSSSSPSESKTNVLYFLFSIFRISHTSPYPEPMAKRTGETSIPGISL